MALVSGSGDGRKGMVSTVVAHKSREEGVQLAFKGVAEFSDSTREHITEVILPIVARILDGLSVKLGPLEISVVNLGAASCHDLGISVSGFSADVPILLAILSAALDIPLRDDFLATGHIASPHGDIAAVQGIPAKLDAVLTDKSIRRFIHGDLEKDRSVAALSPNEKDAALAAIIRARTAVKTRAVNRINDLIVEAFSEEEILLAALKKDFFHIQPQASGSTDPIGCAVQLLTDQAEQRFWKTLQQNFFLGEVERARQLLEAYAESFLQKGHYPEGFGARLLQTVCAIPPAVRHMKLEFPLLGFDRCIRIAQFAEGNAIGDVPILFDAVRGKTPGGIENIVSERPPSPSPESECALFDTVVAQISELELATRFGIPIDSARASFVLGSSKTRSYQDFIETIESFYVHLQGYISGTNPAGMDVEHVKDGAWTLLEQTFQRHGGSDAAFARSRDGTEGGIRSVLDVMTERYKVEQQAQYIEATLKRSLSRMDRDEQLCFMRGALHRLGPLLPAEIREQPPEQFANHADEIAKAYVRSISGIERLLRTM